MDKRKLEIMLLTIVWVLSILTFVLDVSQGFSRDAIIRTVCELVLLSLWTFSVVKRRPTK